MGKGCMEAIYGLMGWKGLNIDSTKAFEILHAYIYMCVHHGNSQRTVLVRSYFFL